MEKNTVSEVKELDKSIEVSTMMDYVEPNVVDYISLRIPELQYLSKENKILVSYDLWISRLSLYEGRKEWWKYHWYFQKTVVLENLKGIKMLLIQPEAYELVSSFLRSREFREHNIKLYQLELRNQANLLDNKYIPEAKLNGENTIKLRFLSLKLKLKSLI
jgi:hypothetical protein